MLPSGGRQPAILGRLTEAGHAVRLAPDLHAVLDAGQLYDAVVLAPTTPASPPLCALADSPLAPVLVFAGVIGATPPDPLAGTGAWREWLADDDPVQAAALLDRLLARKRMLVAQDAAGGELEALQAQLDAARQESRAFALRSSHEFQATWRGMGTALASLEASAGPRLTPAEGRSLALLRQSAALSEGLVRDLLALSQVTLAEIEASAVHLAELARTCIEELAGAGPSVSWRVGPLPVVWGDAALLQMALRHLLANAVKFSRHAETPLVEVRCHEGATGTTLEVLDNGVGFDAAQMHRLFQPLQRLHAADAFDGNGLGLAIVKAVVDRHGGTTSARRRATGGAAFCIVLPRREPAPSQLAPTPAPVRRFSVLLVDDDELVLDTLARALERDGYAVTRARDARAALDFLGHDAHDILVSDWALPGMDGVALVEDARRMRPALRTVLMSGRAGLQDELGPQAVAAIDAFVTKPMPLSTFRAVVGRVLAGVNP